MTKYIFCLATTVLLFMMFTFPSSAQQATDEHRAAPTGFLEKGKLYHFHSLDGVKNALAVEDHTGGNWVKVKIRGDSGWINLDNVTIIAPLK